MAKDSKGNQFCLKTITNCPEDIVIREATILKHLAGSRNV
jgi:hypothetical protein